MHTLEQLAAAANARAIARHQSFVEILKARTGLREVLGTTPLVFDRAEAGELAAFRAFEVARATAERVIDKLHSMGIDHVAISYAEGSGKMCVQARNKYWSGSKFIALEVLLEEWDAAERSVAARHARNEELAGRAPALSEVNRDVVIKEVG